MARTLRSAKQTRLRALLVEARHASEMTQAQVARKLRRHQSFVAKVEGGERRLDIVEFIELAEAVGLDPVKAVRLLQRVK